MKRLLKKRAFIVVAVVLAIVSLMATVYALEVKDSLFYMNTPTFINTKSDANTSGFNITVKGKLE